jgi:hypothetical protein
MVRRRTLAGIECGARGHLIKIYALGIDLGKTVFHLVGLDSSGKWWFGNGVHAHNCSASPGVCRCN